MTVIATDSNRLSNVVKYEDHPHLGLCRDVVTVYDAASTYVVGTVLGKFIASPVGTAGAIVGTGNGAMGAITMTSNANLQLGTYILKIVKAAANAGDFVLLNPQGVVVGNGTVAVAFAQAGFAFTLADGATDFVVGDYLPIVVTGTEKYKKVEATATDGTEVASVIFLTDKIGSYGDLAITANTDTTVVVLSRGKAIVSKSALTFGASVNTADELALAYKQLKALQIFAEATN